MPQLKQLSCCIQWADTNAAFQEYGTVYGDGVVETFIVVPNKPQGFCVRLKSRGFIYSGLAMIVFMDGNYQCNRSRVNLLPPKKDQPMNRTEVDFLLRQREKSQGDGVYMGREWRFDDHNIVTEAPDGFQESHFDDLGTIEVIVLRCRAISHEDAEYGGCSSGEDSDVFGDKPTRDEDEGVDIKTLEKESEDTKITPTPVNQETKSEQGDLELMMGIFDGANDYHEPYGLDRDHKGYGPGQWVWHQRQTPHGLDFVQFQHDSSDRARFKPTTYGPASHFMPQQRQNEQETFSGTNSKRVHFDYGPHEQSRRQSLGPTSQSQNWIQNPPNRPQSRERVRLTERRPSGGLRQPPGPPYEPQRVHENQWNTHKFDQRGRQSAAPPTVQNHTQAQWSNNVDNATRGTGNGSTLREHEMRRTNQEEPQPVSANNHPVSHTAQALLPNLNQSIHMPSTPRRSSLGHIMPNAYHSVPHYPPYAMPISSLAGVPCMNNYCHPYWPSSQPVPCTHPLIHTAPWGQTLTRIKSRGHDDMGGDVSPRNTTHTSPGPIHSPPDMAHDWAGVIENTGDSNANTQGWGSNNPDNSNGNGWTNDHNNHQSGPGDFENNGQNDANASWENTNGDNNGDNPDWPNDNTNDDGGNGNDGWGNDNNAGQNHGQDDWNNNTADNSNGGNPWGDNENDNNNNNNGGSSGWEDEAGGAAQNLNDNSADENVESAAAIANLANTSRQLYGPHGPYYAFKTFRVDDPQPDAEEEPRFDVPKSLAVARGSTKQIQPGPGYRYFKKRMVPEYIDTLENPYARFVFKYRTRDQLPEEIGIEVDVEPTGDQEIRDLQDLDKQALIEMLIRAKSALGGRVPSPPITPSTPATGSDSSLPVAIDAPSYPYLKYSLPPLRPNGHSKGLHEGNVKTGDKVKDDGVATSSNNQNGGGWGQSVNTGNNWGNNTGNNHQWADSKAGSNHQATGSRNLSKSGSWDIPNGIPPRPPTPVQTHQANNASTQAVSGGWQGASQGGSGDPWGNSNQNSGSAPYAVNGW